MISDGITVNGLHSYRDFGLYIKNREIHMPSKKLIQDTVPYMNGYYDFSALCGKPKWEYRTISYTFDIVENSVAQMDAARDRILNWLANAHETSIQDDTIPDYHFIGSYYGEDNSEDGEACELTVEFKCQPFKIANFETVVPLINGSNTVTYDGQDVHPFISATQAGTITVDGLTQSFSANTRTELSCMLINGDNELSVNCAGTIRLYYTEAIL